MKALFTSLLLIILLMPGCASRVTDSRLWNPHPTSLVATEEIYFKYKPIMGWWNRAAAGRYQFQAEDEDFIYYRIENGKIAYGSRFDREKANAGGLALSKTEDIIYVYIEDDYDEVMRTAGELTRAFVKKSSDAKFRVPFGALPDSERRKIRIEREPTGQP